MSSKGEAVTANGLKSRIHIEAAMIQQKSSQRTLSLPPKQLNADDGSPMPGFHETLRQGEVVGKRTRLNQHKRLFMNYTPTLGMMKRYTSQFMPPHGTPSPAKPFGIKQGTNSVRGKYVSQRGLEFKVANQLM